ncbi:hypothetical protein [Shewanella gaetbuli]|nr:hypothetical protein [Shewanella gaetbuli]
MAFVYMVGLIPIALLTVILLDVSLLATLLAVAIQDETHLAGP